MHLAPTFAVIIRLAQRLRQRDSSRVFCFFLDNLFLNVNVAQALLALQICCTGTTRKNAQGIPEWLLKIKQDNRCLVWNSMLAEVVDATLCFVWQDNNAVAGITTAHSLKNETIERNRKRPAPTSTNARIVRPVFGDSPYKRLHIPCVIDDYNHYMNGVDRANQLRKNLTVHRPGEQRNWRPMWNWLLDVCAVNSYLLYKGPRKDTKKRGQRCFRNQVIKALLDTPTPPKSTTRGPYKKLKAKPNWQNPNHAWVKLAKSGYCVWCKQERGQASTEITNQANSGTVQGRTKTKGGCQECAVHLCLMQGCFKKFHSQ